MERAGKRRFGAPMRVLLVCSALGACAPGVEEGETDPPDESAGPMTASVTTPDVGGAQPAVSSSSGTPELPFVVTDPPDAPSVAPAIALPPTPAMPIEQPVVDLPTPLPVGAPVPALEPEPIVAPVPVDETPEPDPLPRTDPVNESPDIDPEEADALPTDSPFEIVDKPFPETDPVEEQPGTGGSGIGEPDPEADGGDGGDGPTPEDSGSEERPNGELLTHDPDGIPYCD